MLAEKNEVFREAESTIRRLSADERIRLCCEAEEQISRIIEIARKYAPEYDVDEIFREWNS